MVHVTRLFAILFLSAAVAAIAVYLAHSTGSQDPAPPSNGPTTPASPNSRKDPDPGPPIFQDVTSGSGLDFTHRNGEEAGQYTILESLGGGIVLIDFDQDGWLDIFLPGGGHFTGPSRTTIAGHPCKLFRNLGQWKFADVTGQVGLEGISFYSHGGAVADYDRDGWPDLLVTGYGQLRLFRNVPGPEGKGRRFQDVTEELGLKNPSWSTSAAFADMNGDGYPDLYVCHYVDWSFENHPLCRGLLPNVPRQVCAPQSFKPLVDTFYWNEQGKRFRDASAEQSLAAVGCGLGVVAADLNGDRRPDLYVANDATDNQLLLNRNGKLEECGLKAGVALDDEGNYDGSMGVDIADYDGSGRPSIWVTNFQGDLHALYRNVGNESFQHRSRAAGLGALGSNYVGFGTAFLDFDLDGWEDLVIANGHVIRHPILGATHAQRPRLLRNVDIRGERGFHDVSHQGGVFFSQPRVGRGLAVADLDHDGRPDFVVSHTNSPVALLRNMAGEGGARHWIGLELQGKDHRCLVGSTVKIQAGPRTLTRFLKGGGSYLSQPDGRVIVGLGSYDGPVTITIDWSWGGTTTWGDLATGSYWVLRETGEAPTRREYVAPKS